LPGYARWWLAEVRGMLPETLSGWFAGDSAKTDIGIDDTGLHLVRLEGGRARVIQTIAKTELGTHPMVRELIATERDRVRLVLASSDSQALVRTLTLPAAIEENLKEAISFEIDRVTPFKAEQVYFAAQVVSRDAQRETIDVELAVAPKARADALIATAREAGLSVGEMIVEPAAVGARVVDLLPVSMKPAAKWGQRTRWNLVLLALAVVLALIAVLLPVWQKRERVIALIPLVEKAGAEFAVNRKVYDEYAKLAGEYNHIATKKHGAQPALALIEEVTRMSPDTTFVQTFELKTSGKTRELTMMGEAASASKVIESLEQSPLFQNATQRAQTTRGSQPNTERFHIATEVKPRPIPTAVLIEASAPVVSVPPAPPTTPAPVATVTPPPPPVEAKNGGSDSKAAPPRAETLPAGQALPAHAVAGTPVPPPSPPPVKAKP
jgi:general secretion pathway protein L